jgi:hypothetical protein
MRRGFGVFDDHTVPTLKHHFEPNLPDTDSAGTDRRERERLNVTSRISATGTASPSRGSQPVTAYPAKLSLELKYLGGR